MASEKSYTIVIKLGSSSLVDEVTKEPRIANIAHIVETVVKLRRENHRIVIVSSGAIAFGMKKIGMDIKPKRISAVQALASVGQGELIALFDGFFKQVNQPIGQILLTRNDILDYTQYKNATNTMNELLSMGIIPIVNENDTLSVREIKFGDNDTLSAITAGMIHADCLFLMTDVECLYTENPRNNPDAKPIFIVENINDLDATVKTDESTAGTKVGTGGMTTKIIAAELASNAGVTTIVTLSSKPDAILSIVKNIQSITEGKFSFQERKDLVTQKIEKKELPMHTTILGLSRDVKIRSDRKFWILHGLKTKGSICIDTGCFEALTRKNRAGLLPAGIVSVQGYFHASECVSIKLVPRENATPEEYIDVGRCRVNYSSSEINLIKGSHSHEIESILGFGDSEYVAHREDLAFSPHLPQKMLTSNVDNDK